MNTKRMGLLTAAVLAASVSSLGLAGVASAGSQAAAVLTYGSPSGPAVPVGDTLSAPLASGTQLSLATTLGGSAGVFCTSTTFSATVETNGSTTATENPAGLTPDVSTCKPANLGVVTGVKSAVVTTTGASVASGGAITVNGVDVHAVLATLFGNVTCDYKATSISGSASNTDNSISFSDQHLSETTGTAGCPVDGYFTAKFAPVTGPGGLVFVN